MRRPYRCHTHNVEASDANTTRPWHTSTPYYSRWLWVSDLSWSQIEANKTWPRPHLDIVAVPNQKWGCRLDIQCRLTISCGGGIFVKCATVEKPRTCTWLRSSSCECFQRFVLRMDSNRLWPMEAIVYEEVVDNDNDDGCCSPPLLFLVIGCRCRGWLLCLCLVSVRPAWMWGQSSPTAVAMCLIGMWSHHARISHPLLQIQPIKHVFHKLQEPTISWGGLICDSPSPHQNCEAEEQSDISMTRIRATSIW